MQRDYRLLASAIEVAIAGSNLDTAAWIMNRICDSGEWFSVGQESTEIPYLFAVRWEIRDREHSIFWLNRRSDCSLEAFEALLSRLVLLLPLLASYRGCRQFSPGTVVLDMGDVPRVPGLAFTGYNAKARREHFLIPDPEFMVTLGYADMRESAKAIPWDQRLPVALWRGSTTGFPIDADRGWRSFPRVALCEISRAHSDIIDAGVTLALQPYIQMPSPELERDLHEADLMRSPIPHTDFAKYKYQIDIDGNSNSWSGPFRKLLTGSPLLKVASLYGYRQWYYDCLQPWVNYVPVADDMSDLVEKIEWLRAHDDVARRIGENGHALAMSLSYDGEIRVAGRTIAAAIRYFSNRPDAELQFRSEIPKDVRLLDGWAGPTKEGVLTLGQSSRLDLPRPVASEAFVLTLDLSPFTEEPAPPVQRIGVVVNGEVLREAILSERIMLRYRVPWQTIMAADCLNITLLHPDATSLASASRALDSRPLSLVLHGLTLTPYSVYLATVGKKLDVLPPDPVRPVRKVSGEARLPSPYTPYRVIGSGNDDGVGAASEETYLYGPDVWVPPEAFLNCIQTHWGTLVFADIAHGTLRHGPEKSEPKKCIR